jgi:transmembrane sensor
MLRMDTNYAKQLLQKYQQGHCNDKEKTLVEEWYKQLQETGELQWNEEEKQKWQVTMESHLLNKINESGSSTTPVHRIHLLRRARWWAAAVIIIMLGIGSYVILSKPKKQEAIVNVQPAKDVAAPDKTKAFITMADGKIIYLDSMSVGTIGEVNNVTISKSADGKIVYSGNANEVVYNTLNNPRGSKVIDMKLSDGSHVWLNAGSSVTYPMAFTGNERKVSITGEAYFEVAHDATKPFIVNQGDMNVQVLGTHFNVNAYDDEENIKITLLEGLVKVNTKTANTLLKPSQQAMLSGNGQLAINNNVDVDAVMAWKNGLFNFKKANIQTVMRQLARWYDVEVEFEGKMPATLFGGEIQRNILLSKVLANLEKNGVRFRIEGKKIIVL